MVIFSETFSGTGSLDGHAPEAGFANALWSSGNWPGDGVYGLALDAGAAVSLNNYYPGAPGFASYDDPLGLASAEQAVVFSFTYKSLADVGVDVAHDRTGFRFDFVVGGVTFRVYLLSVMEGGWTLTGPDTGAVPVVMSASTEYTGTLEVADGVQKLTFLGQVINTTTPFSIAEGFSHIGLDMGYGGSMLSLGVSAQSAVVETITADLSIPMMTLDAGFGASAELLIPMMTLDASAHDSTGENSFQGVIPMMTLDAGFGMGADLTIPMMVLDAAMTVTAVITVELSIPMMTLDAQGTGSPYIVTADLSIPMMTLDAGFGMGADLSIPMMTLDASVTSGGLLTASLSIPMMTLDAQATQQNRGWLDLTIPMMVPTVGITADLTIPMMVLDAAMTAVVTVSYEAYAVNLNHTPKPGVEPVDEATRYTNFPFTQIVRYQNSYFGVAADGLYLLEGTTDAGTNIAYAVKTAMSDFKTPLKKTVAAVYFGGRLGPTSTVALHVGEDGANSYSFTTPRGDHAQNHRQVFGKGVKARYYALSVEGTGALELDSIELDVRNMTRRI